MFRDQEEELNRLENALLEQEEEPLEEAPEEEDFDVEIDTEFGEEYEEEYEEDYEEEEDWEEDTSYRAYTNHHSDVDLEDYSEEVYEARPDRTLRILIWLFIVLTGLVCGTIFLLLKVGGFL